MYNEIEAITDRGEDQILDRNRGILIYIDVFARSSFNESARQALLSHKRQAPYRLIALAPY